MNLSLISVDTSLSLENINNLQYIDIVSGIKNKNLAALFNHILKHKEDVEKQISENKKAFEANKNPKLTIVLISVAIISLGILLSLGIYGGPSRTQNEYLLPFIMSVNASIFTMVMSAVFAIKIMREKNLHSNLLLQNQEKLEVNQIHIKSMLERIIDFDQGVNSSTDVDIILKNWITCGDPNPYYEKFLSSMYEYLPENDIIRTHMTTIFNYNTLEKERIRAWKYLEIELESSIHYIEAHNTKFFNPKIR